MRKIIVLCVLIGIALLSLSRATSAQTVTPPSPTPLVVTATPMPQVIVVTATPSGPATPKTFWDENSTAIGVALIALVSGVILSPLLRPLFEGLGKALAEGLGRLGTGWGFKKRYLTHLIEEYRGLNIRGRKTRAPVAVELERVYVSLRAQVPDTVLGQQEPPSLSIGQALVGHERLAILGGPGTGKTTLLAYLTLTYARGQASERLGLEEKRLPVLVPLRQLKQVLDGDDGQNDAPDVEKLQLALKRVLDGDDGRDGISTLPAYLAKWYTRLGMRPRENFFEHALRDGRCLVLLDGLDEVADAAERRRMSEWVDGLVALYPNNRYVVTSRPPGYDSAPLSNGFTVLRIRDFSAEEIRQFAANWCLAVELAAQGEDNPTVRRRVREAAGDLVAAIEANADIRKLAVNPLLLSIIALVHRYRATLPKRRVDLYAECVDVLLGHWDEAKGLVGRLSPGQTRAVLQPLALRMHQGNQRDVSRHQLEARIGELLPAVGGEEADAASFLDEVRERSGLLVEVGLDTYAFSHLTFQEYLCAREIVDNEEVRSLLLERAGDEWWQEVTLLYVGMAEATPFIDALLAGEDDEAGTQLLLAGRCVAEAVQVREATREQVLRLLEGAFATCTGKRFMETGQVLADVAGEDSVDFFLCLAHDDPARRGAALWSLGQMGCQPNEALRERVLERIRAHLEEGALRQEAGLALVCAQDVGVDDQVLLDGLQRERSDVLLAALAQALDGRMIEIPAGEFLMGSEKRRVPVDAFQIDRYPVTNAQYKRFLDAKPEHPVPFVDSDWARPYNWDRPARTFPPDKAGHPVVLVSWHDAVAYAGWAGKRLPTEEEWEKAARSTDGREYPWGDQQPTPDLCNFGGNVDGTTSIGQYSPQGDSPYGCVDMAGNAWEWTASDYGKNSKVLRGGAWGGLWGLVRAADRLRFAPGVRGSLVGFRCVGLPGG